MKSSPNLDFNKIFSKKPKILMVVSNSDRKVYESISGCVGNFVNDMRPVVFVTFKYSYKFIMNFLQKKDIDTDLVIVIDTVTRQWIRRDSNFNCIYLNMPLSLTDISVALDSVLSLMDNPDLKKGVLVLDSLDNITKIDHNLAVVRFVNFILTKAKQQGFNCMVTSSDKIKKSVIYKEVLEFSDVLKKL